MNIPISAPKFKDQIFIMDRLPRKKKKAFIKKHGRENYKKQSIFMSMEMQVLQSVPYLEVKIDLPSEKLAQKLAEELKKGLE